MAINIHWIGLGLSTEAIGATEAAGAAARKDLATIHSSVHTVSTEFQSMFTDSAFSRHGKNYK
jgi:hypothetical protein